MINISKNETNNFVLELAGLSTISCSGSIIFKFIHIHTQSVVYFTTDDISTSCRYNEYVLIDDDDETRPIQNDWIWIDDDAVNLLAGQWDYQIILIEEGEDIEEYIESDYSDPISDDYISEGIMIVTGIDENIPLSLQ